jgi:signal transduction histidine kinase
VKRTVAGRERLPAASIAVTVAADPATVELQVSDDGAGFGPGRRAAALRAGHVGLASSERRVQALGGELVVDSRPDRGTRVRAVLPNR